MKKEKVWKPDKVSTTKAKKKIPLAIKRRVALQRYVIDYGNALVKETVNSLLQTDKESKTLEEVKKFYSRAGKKLIEKIETLYKLNK